LIYNVIFLKKPDAPSPAFSYAAFSPFFLDSGGPAPYKTAY